MVENDCELKLGSLLKESFVACCPNKVYCIQRLVEVIEESRKKQITCLRLRNLWNFSTRGAQIFGKKKIGTASKLYVHATRHEASAIMRTLQF